VSTQATVVNGMQPEPGLDPLAAVEGSDDVAAVAGVLTPPDPSPSVLDIIERKLADADKSKRIELRMPVPHPLLEFNQMVANYRLLTDGDRAGLASRARERGANPDGSPKDNEQALELAADVLVTACVGIYVRQVPREVAGRQRRQGDEHSARRVRRQRHGDHRADERAHEVGHEPGK
jgi:hypothetical protein